MRTHKYSPKLGVCVAVLALASLLTATSAAAQSVTILHNFDDNGKDGFHPWAGLTFDSSGDLYGTTQRGGAKDNGTAFKLTPISGGGWTETILHSFLYDGIDGYDPNGGLILDSAGNLYGTASLGGSGTCTNPIGIVIGCGIVFELQRLSNGSYTENILYNFQNNARDGLEPWSALIMDSAGNLYGTTLGGGSDHYGTVFELAPPSSTGGKWTETILWNFNKTDGSQPRAALIFDAAGDLYGTTQNGGAYNFGTVFELSPTAGGTWTETVLHSFKLSSTELAYPEAPLIFDSAGNLYSTTSYGSQIGGGGVFELSPSTGGMWTESILYFFKSGTDGYNSWSPLIFDSHGNLYGTTSSGGTGQCKQIGLVIGCGTIFKLTPSEGTWTESIVYNFDFRPNNDPEGPEGSGLISDSAGNFYGTTYAGGAYTHGTVFEFAP
jgi:uncharacterized repeat protein (TIGR03803 family)